MGVQDVLMLEVSPQGLSHRGRAHLIAQLSAPPHPQIGILRGYLESQGPMKTGKMTTHNSGLCAVLYSKIFKQVSGQGWPRQQGRVASDTSRTQTSPCARVSVQTAVSSCSTLEIISATFGLALSSPKCRPEVA